MENRFVSNKLHSINLTYLIMNDSLFQRNIRFLSRLTTIAQNTSTNKFDFFPMGVRTRTACNDSCCCMCLCAIHSKMTLLLANCVACETHSTERELDLLVGLHMHPYLYGRWRCNQATLSHSLRRTSVALTLAHGKQSHADETTSVRLATADAF